MRLLLIHVESLHYETRIDTPIAVEIEEDEREREFGESLLVLYTTERQDEANPERSAELASLEIENYMSKIGDKPVVLFPFAFLVSREEKSSSETAAKMGELLRTAIGGTRVSAVPFGWYKKFSITSMGHKYAVHSARVTPD